MDQSKVESLASSLVREYLSRRGCKKTLAELDKEFPRGDQSISNRLQLIHAMSIEPWVKSNRRHTQYKTLIEVVVHNTIANSPHGDAAEHKRPASAQPSPSRLLKHDRAAVLNDPQATVKHTSASHKQKQLLCEDITLEDINGPVNSKSSIDLAVAQPERFSKPQKVPEKVAMSQKPNFVSTNKKSGKEEINFEAFLDFLQDDSDKTPEVKKPVVKTKQSLPTKVLLNSSNSSEDLVFDADVACKLRMLLFGSDRRGFNIEWSEQGFQFNDCRNGQPLFLRIGIHQKKGGPCGLLSAVQATMLKHFLFADSQEVSMSDVDRITDRQRTNALEKSIVEMIWRGRVGEGAAYLAVMSISRQFEPPPQYRADGITEHVSLIACRSHDELRQAVKQHIGEYEKGKGSCILLLYSLILTHGVDNIKSEMDEENGRLLGMHGYCTQEMINLLLQGHAFSNAFDNTISLGEDALLKGITHQSDVGLLSLFEHYGSIKIGSYYKSPRYPIWLVCSESHFTVLFSLKRAIASLSKFDLFYYDGLANQDEVIRLTMDCRKSVRRSDTNQSLIPPLEHCIRTKWPSASVDWNDTEPIL